MKNALQIYNKDFKVQETLKKYSLMKLIHSMGMETIENKEIKDWTDESEKGFTQGEARILRVNPNTWKQIYFFSNHHVSLFFEFPPVLY